MSLVPLVALGVGLRELADLAPVFRRVGAERQRLGASRSLMCELDEIEVQV